MNENSVERIAARLGGIPLFENLSADELKTIAAEVQWRPFLANETIAAAGEFVTEFLVIT
jgi:hypothetical protein